MPVAYTLDQSRRIVFSRAWGTLGLQALLDHATEMHRLFDEGTIEASWRQFADFSEVLSFDDLSTARVRQMAAFNPWPPAAGRIFLAPQTEAYGLTRMYQLLLGTGGAQLRIVRSADEANELLALSDAPSDSGH